MHNQVVRGMRYARQEALAFSPTSSLLLPEESLSGDWLFREEPLIGAVKPIKCFTGNEDAISASFGEGLKNARVNQFLDDLRCNLEAFPC